MTHFWPQGSEREADSTAEHRRRLPLPLNSVPPPFKQNMETILQYYIDDWVKESDSEPDELVALPTVSLGLKNG